MADLSPSERSGNGGGPDASGRADRGQLLVVGALVLGTVLILLVLLVNASIYAENLATRNPDVGDEEALAYRAAVVDGVGGVLDRENAEDYDSYGALTGNVSESIRVLDEQLLRIHVRSGVEASIDRSSVVLARGRLLRQAEARPFTDASGTPEWAAALNTNGTRGFVATVNRSSLATTNASNIEADGSNADGAFYVAVSENTTTTEWRAYVYNDSSTGNLSVAVKRGGDSAVTRVCSVDATIATLNFTDGRLDGEPCAGFQWGEGTSGRYDVSFSNGNSANGTYNLTARVEDAGSVPGVGINDGTASDDPGSPYSVPAVYGARLELGYESPELEYETQVRIAPGESDD